MIRFYLTMIGLCCSMAVVLGQETTKATGFIMDDETKVKLHQASVVILHAKDSIIHRFTRADKSGQFSIESIPQGDYILLVTYPDYADYVEEFSVTTETPLKDFGDIELRLRARLIEEVLVRGAQAITIKGDTTEFDARSFVIQPNDKVEDLLRQLPGITVDQDGKITAQGKTVEKVLVDGEEFFGDDPTLVTKNLRSDMVDKVQLYEKQSDQAEFTGVDDGERAQTINITLREDKKKGYFGKIDAGAGTDDMYEGQAMFNWFNNKQRVSAYGTIGNTGKTGLSWQDNDRFGASSGNMSMTDDGGMMISFSGGEDEIEGWSGQYDGRGIPLAHTGGAHYSNKWNEDKQSINASYKVGQLQVSGWNGSLTQNNLASGFIQTENDQDFDRVIFRQRATGIYEVQLDSTANLKITVDGTIRNSDNNEFNDGLSLNGEGDILNTSIRNIMNTSNGTVLNATALWTKKLRKKGRTLSWNLTQNYNDANTDGFLFSNNVFFGAAGAVDSVLLVDQLKINNTVSSVTSSNVTYTEPLSETLSLVLNYGLNWNNGTRLLQSFNQGAAGNYDDLDLEFSNDFKLSQLTNQVGAIFNWKKNRHTINGGTRVSDVRFNQTDRFTNTRFERNFANWNPQLRWQFRIAQGKSMNISYSGNNAQPQLTQIQPVRENTNPLNIIEGNPDLRPSFTNRINGSYNFYKVMSGTSLYLYGTYSNTLNPIVSNVFTNEAGASVSRFDNLTDNTNSNFNIYSSYSRKVTKHAINAGVNFNANGSVFHNIVNGDLNRTLSYRFSPSLQASQYVEKKFDYYLSAGPQYNISVASLQEDFNNNGWGATGYASFNVFLPSKFRIGMTGNYSFTAATQSFSDDFSRLLVNANVNRRFLKDETLTLKLSVNDLFNQNVGFSRFDNQNFQSENYYTTIRRYFMLSVIWDFNKMGGGVSQ